MNKDTAAMKALRLFCSTLSEGDQIDKAKITGLIAACWNDLAGNDEGGMQAEKILDRLEDISWKPPVVRFSIARHAGTMNGSNREMMQHWKIDTEARTAHIDSTGHRQLQEMAPRVDLRKIANEICDAILSGKDHNQVKRHGNEVEVKTRGLCPIRSRNQQTQQSRINGILDHIAIRLECHGFERHGFARNQKNWFRRSD